MRILLYSDDLEEQDVIDKLFVYLYQFLSQDKTVFWLRKYQLDILPSEEACKELNMDFLDNLLLHYYGRRFRSEISDILNLCDADEEYIDGMIPILLEIEREMKKINPESEVFTAFSDDTFDKDVMRGFKIVWNAQLYKL
uniref:Uncharacterized protein n=1 Tax=Panagrolaimus sp. ES5 TaxID=591445 RepID=A0AC34FWK3_9BILA